MITMNIYILIKFTVYKIALQRFKHPEDIFNQMFNELKVIESNKCPSDILKPLFHVLINNICPCFIVGVKTKSH